MSDTVHFAVSYFFSFHFFSHRLSLSFDETAEHADACHARLPLREEVKVRRQNQLRGRERQGRGKRKNINASTRVFTVWVIEWTKNVRVERESERAREEKKVTAMYTCSEYTKCA